ncbi:MAG: pimeloyl-ACP methyl ester esterase BioH [Gammaproteobacteria bacterium]|nr:pimeloyl-ACP methyl ester esterase BioH [Gammaproteobacteria bacterium]
MKLHVQHHGNPSNPPLALLHGWALHGDFWPELVDELAQHYYCYNIDLPGHGQSASGTWTLTQFSQTLAQTLPPQCVVLGWSLGGIAAQHFALNYPMHLKALVLVASTPRFLRAPDWPHAAKHDAFDQLASDMHQQFEKTVGDFMKLTLLSGERPKVPWRELQRRAFQHSAPDAKSLQNGLNILAATDFRFHVERIYAPTLCLSGSHDRLTPPQASEFMAEKITKGEWVNIQGAGHAPFMSHPEAFQQALMPWLANLS